ncbi:MAG TPA: UDP-2,3-diacylglucosamine diphosphatase [Thermoanaerobaculia bacterium]|nr:UDP-2,3-diacylglucosamine diphosphatase [Thermoanaerobaculia bacterium]
MIAAGQIFVIGDSHIGLAAGSEARILAWVDRLEALQPRALYLNGDLFHYLIAHPKFFTSAIEKVFERLRRLRDSGIGVHYVEGNRDFFLRGSFAEKSVTDVAVEYALLAGGRKYLIVHGDMINDHDYPYRFWRMASKNPVSKFSLKLIPQKAARRFVENVEKKLSRTNFKHKSRLPLAQMENYARRRRTEGFTNVVFGHFHEKLVMPAGDAIVTIVPPWYENGEAMVINPATGEFDWTVV